jgi:CheY-like chemotaxis protein
MNHKVLLADDSLTIQKVIKITLANQPYEITEASSEEELFHQLPLLRPKLVFLDFNLSEKYTGYELTTKIKSIIPNAKVLLLLGTFDTVDDASMEKCGASDKIVKPFDSNKFIAICKQLIDTFADEDLAYPETKSVPESDFDSEEDQWKVSHSTEQKLPEPERRLDNSFPDLQNPLLKEVSDWGMSVPGIIDEKASHTKTIDIPPVIGGEVTSLHEHKAKKEEVSKPAPQDEPRYPETDDLDYPTIEELTPAPKHEGSKISSQFISLDSFHDKTGEFEIDHAFMGDETDIKSLEAQIRDEVEDNLWHADEFEDLKKEVHAKIEEAKVNFQPTLNDFDESLFKPIDDSESITWHDTQSLFTEKTEPKGEMTASPSVNLDEVKNEMEEMVKKYVKEYMDQMFQKNAEKVAWEVIPDLAENLIRQELSKISNKIINDQT